MINVNAKNKKDNTPLDLAILNGHIEVVKLLLEEPETQTNLAKENGATPLHLACRKGYTEIAGRGL